jgi:ubiquinone/menaquinone biosynthesis C-methylase UbiE
MPSWSGHIHRYAAIEKPIQRRERKLTNNQDSFDFIHFRELVQGITKWSQVPEEAYRCVKPGGYVELSESHRKVGNTHASPDLLIFF